MRTTVGDVIRQHKRNLEEKGYTVINAKPQHLMDVITSRVFPWLDEKGYKYEVKDNSWRSKYVRRVKK